MSSPFLLLCIAPAEGMGMQDALGAFLCGKWNIHIRKASSDQPARDWWWFLQHWQLLQKHSASQVCSWAPAASKICGKVHREGVGLPFWDTGLALLSGFSVGHLSGCVSASLLCSFQVGRDYPPSCCRDLHFMGLWHSLECSLIDNCWNWRCLPWNAESSKSVMVHSFLGRGRRPSEMAENSEGWEGTLYPHLIPCGICCFLP